MGLWAKNLLFATVVLTGLGGMAYVVRPGYRPGRPEQLPAVHFTPSEVQATVEGLNAALRQSWQTAGVAPAPRAEDLAIARRISLALTGTIPSLEEIRKFEAYPGEGRLAWWTSHLLADRRSADYLAERFTRAYVGVVDGPFLLFRRRRFRIWLADELYANRPYDQLVRDLIATDGVWTDRPAANFITATINPDDENNKPNVNALAGRVTRAFLGIRLDCAECHDHPFAAWKQRDFQGLAAFFAQTENALFRGESKPFQGIREGSGELEAEDYATGEKHVIAPAAPFQPELLPSAPEHRRARLAAWVTHPENKAFARATVNRIWALLYGRALVEPVDDIPLDDVPAALDVLADDFSAHGYDLRRLIGAIVLSESFARDSAADDEGASERQEQTFAAFPLTRLRPEQVIGAVWQAARLSTVDDDSHILVQLTHYGETNDFITRYGDAGEDEFEPQSGTIPQRLLMMNGDLVHGKIEQNPLANAATQLAWLAPDDQSAVEGAYLAVLTRRPTREEADHFIARLRDSHGDDRARRVEDLYWTLLNSTEFSWNH
ncbi:MAG: DUF1549 domain-containing protein [Planctomycetia bacterium]|nr:DUF1549 domain-containing protein [Planctomycetia bacterium]